MNSLETDELDFSWLSEQEKLQTIQQNFHREPNKTIRLQFIYINLDNEIADTYIEKYQIKQLSEDRKAAVLSEDELLHILQDKKRRTKNTNYIIYDLLLFNIDLEHDHIPSFINYSEKEILENKHRFMKPVSYVNTIRFSPSIFIFHDINTLCFIFKERKNREIPV